MKTQTENLYLELNLRDVFHRIYGGLYRHAAISGAPTKFRKVLSTDGKRQQAPDPERIKKPPERLGSQGGKGLRTSSGSDWTMIG